MPLPCMQRKPASITDHLLLSIMMGTRAISGSDAIKFKNRTMAAWLSSMASSILMSMICAPFSTCWRATAKACSYSPFKIMRAKALEPVTLVRSPMLTKVACGCAFSRSLEASSLSMPVWLERINTGSKPDNFMGGTVRDAVFIDSPGGCETGERRCEEMSQAWLCGKLQRSLRFALF